MQIISNRRKMEMAAKHPNDFKLGACIGSVVPLITLGFKLATSHGWAYYILVALCGSCSLMSIYTFGLASFGQDRYGHIKTAFFCVVIELGWILLPYKIPPSDPLEWTWLILAFLTFVAAIYINALEFAGMMAYLHDKAEQDEEQHIKVIEAEKQNYLDQINVLKAKAEKVEEMSQYIRRIVSQKKIPRVRKDDNKVVMFDQYDKQASPLVLCEIDHG